MIPRQPCDFLPARVHPNAQLSPRKTRVGFNRIVATKDQKRHARGLIETLESRVHAGPPVGDGELHSVREFLRPNDFPAASDYYRRLGQIQHRLEGRPAVPVLVPAKRNYGGEAAGRWMQLQSAYD